MCTVNPNRPGSSEAVCLESRRHSRLFQRGIVVFFGFGGRDVADTIDPLEGCELERLEAARVPEIHRRAIRTTDEIDKAPGARTCK